MRLGTGLSWLCLGLTGVSAQGVQDACPKNEIACHDVMNSSQCIEQIILERLSPLSKAALVKCVEHEGTASNLPGASKLCRCPGCHTTAINTVLAEMFPPPCS
ncbi:hypothetical protein B0T25DRAFT_565250 [Lasiosphaeria hispida]|uniref:Uncharacterized protein n=1 Tax=Lasiosphaeria hispida TaxID=260671 RepID=A0AAJ0HS27_9PEZI|nr:hypothetical protein B0T25DRAFT_565250 [Lasiosphaeria hispida]